MLCLGVESTAHTFGAGLVDEEGNVLSDIKKIYKDPDGGLNPLKARQHHLEVSPGIVAEALGEHRPQLVSFSAGPGLGPSLTVGMETARNISKKFGVPLIGVNHCIGHIEIGRLTTGAKDPVVAYLSGGNSQILAFVNGRYRAIGETLDIAIGNALDKFARTAGLKGAPDIEREAKKGTKLLDLPYTAKGMDFSFSGLVTHCERMLGKENLSDLCYSFQEYAFAMIVEVAERAMAALDKKEVLLTGGVAANRRLGEMLSVMAQHRGGQCLVVKPEYSGDNGAMIAWVGILMHKHNQAGIDDIRPRWRPDEVDIPWMEQ